jgi:hypothetical protein
LVLGFEAFQRPSASRSRLPTVGYSPGVWHQGSVSLDAPETGRHQERHQTGTSLFVGTAALDE